MSQGGLGGNFDASTQSRQLQGKKKNKIVLYVVGAACLLLFIAVAYYILSGDPRELIYKRNAVARLARDIERLGGGSVDGLKLDKVSSMSMREVSKAHTKVWQKLRDTRSTHRSLQNEIRDMAEQIRGFGDTYDLPRGMTVKSIVELKKLKQHAQVQLDAARHKHRDNLDKADMEQEAAEIRADITAERRHLEELGLVEQWDDLTKYTDLDQLDSILAETESRREQVHSENFRKKRQEEARERRTKELAKKEIITNEIEGKLKKLEGTLSAMEKLRLNIDYWEYNTPGELKEKNDLADQLLKRKDLTTEIRDVCKKIKEVDGRVNTVNILASIAIKPPVSKLQTILKQAKDLLSKTRGSNGVPSGTNGSAANKGKAKAKAKMTITRMRTEAELIEKTAILEGKNANDASVVADIKRRNSQVWDYLTDAQLKVALDNTVKKITEGKTKQAAIDEIKAQVAAIKKIDPSVDTSEFEKGVQISATSETLNKKLKDATLKLDQVRAKRDATVKEEKVKQATRDEIKNICTKIKKLTPTADCTEFVKDIEFYSQALLDSRLRRAQTKLTEVEKATA